MKKILILYHSGVGNTKKIAEKIYNKLSGHFYAELYSVEKIPDKINLNDYDGLVIGFPVIHTHPSKRILNFIDNIDILSEPKPTYIYTTCGWYSANTLRIFAKKCMSKNIVTVMHRVYWGCPATDGSLLAPYIKRFFTFRKNLNKDINFDMNNFSSVMENKTLKLNIPRFKLYSILNYPNKIIGNLSTFPIYIHNKKCIKCEKCIKNCPAKALKKDKIGYPVFSKENCEKCYRCIHHCPTRALSLSKKRTPKKVIN